MYRCPICGSSRIEQYKMPYGEMWCLDCGFRVEDKSVIPNPFFVEEETVVKPVPIPLGEQMAALYKSKRGKKK